MTFSVDDFARALESHDYRFEVGQTVTGKPFSHTNEGVYIDIGGKAAALLPLKEVNYTDTQPIETVVPLEIEREFLIIRGQDAEGQVVLSIRRLEEKALWQHLEEAVEDGTTLQVNVTGTNRGGITVNYEGLRGFIPRSHLIDRETPDSLVGQRLGVVALEVSRDRKKLVFSQRLASQTSRMQELQVGDLVTGTIRDFKPFGVFVDLDGVTGLLHIQQISQNYVKSLDPLLKLGDTIQSIILDLDPQRGRISLCTKVLENYPGEILENFAGVMQEAQVRAKKHQDKLQQGLET